MNTAYKTIWNAAIGAWVAVSEATRSRGKRSTGQRAGRAMRLAGPLIAATGFAMTLPAWAACVLTGTTLDCTGTSGGFQGVPDGGTINNNGTIGTLDNDQWGIYVGSNVTVNNYGAITGKAGIVAGGGLVVNNVGGSIVAVERGIQATNGPINLTNSQGGLIQGFGGALIYAGGTILNTGNSVIDGTGYFALGFANSSASITNTAGSTIRGAYSIFAQDTKITLDNGGLIQGDVLLANNRVNNITLRTGSRIQGTLYAGGTATSTLTLAGSGTQVYSQAVSGNTNFDGALIKEDSGDWLLDRSFAPADASVNAGSLGFGAGGSFSAGTAVSLAAGTKLYTAPGGAAVIGHLAGAAGSTVSLAAGSSLDMRDDLDSDIAGDISGAGVLIHSGTGTVALSGNNSNFAGGIVASAGTLQLANQQALGGAALGIGGPVTLTSPTALTLGSVNLFAPAGQLSVVVPGAVTFNGVVSGAGTLDLRNIAGVVSLLGNNTYNGGTRLANNTVALGTDKALGQGVVSVEGSATLTNAATRSLANAFVIGNGGSLTVGGNAGIAISGPVSGDGGIVKVGADEFALTGDNTYAGGTHVAQGTLRIANAAGSATGTGAVTVDGGATLAGSGSIAGPVSVAAGGRLSVGTGTGVMNTGSLTLAAGSSLDMELGEAGVAGGLRNDLLNVNGDLSLGGTLNVSESAGGNFGAGLYRLINYTGTLTSNAMTIGSAPTPPGYLALQTGVANQINLVNTGGLALNMWDGGNPANFNDGKIAGGTGTWRAGSPGDNWTDVNGVANAGWIQDGFAIFGGSAGTVTVDNTGVGGAVRIGGAQFAVDGYVVNGNALTIGAPDTTVRVGDGSAAGTGMTAAINAAIGGAGGLVKEDVGTLVLGGANTYAGGTTIKGGTLQISADNNLGAAGTGLALDGGTLRIAAGSAPFTSTRSLALGAGGGTIDLSNNAYGLGGSITGGGLLTVTGSGGTLGLAAAGNYTGGTVLKDGAGITTTVSGALGSGAVQQQGNGTRLSFLGAASAGANSYSVGRAASADSGNTLSFSQTATAGNATITVNGAGWTTAGPNALQFGGNSSAGASTIVNQGGSINLFENGSAGTATITNGDKSLLAFGMAASAGSAKIFNQAGGLVRFADTSSGANASVTNAAGGTVDVSGSTAKTGTELGSLSGDGAVVLGATRLSLGGLNANNLISGKISDDGSPFAQPGTGVGGSIVKVGSGTLALTGANTYTGGTTVAAGTLSVSNTSGSATGSGAVVVQSGAVLAGTGTASGAVTIAKGGTLSAGNGGVGTLTLGSLSLAEGAVLNYDLGQANTAGGALNDLVNVNGNLQLDGTLNVAQPSGGLFGAGIYRLINYTGALTDNGLDIGSAPVAAKDLQVQTSVAQQVNLVNRSGLSLNFWDGGDAGKYNDGQVAGGSGTWRVGVPGDGWTGADGKINAAWVQDQFAVFGGKGGTVTVDDAGGTVRIGGAQFAASGYVVQGDAIELGAPGTVVRVGDGSGTDADRTATLDVALTGAGGLVKEDVGRLVLRGANTYTGGTTVKAGVLQGSATSLQGDIVDNAEVAFDQDKSAGTYAGVLSGSGRVRKIGTGTLVLGGVNSYAGGTFVDAGTLATNITGGLGSGAVSVAAAGTLQFGGKADAGAAPIGNQGIVRFQDNASAGTSTITNAAGGVLAFADGASADKATVLNQAGAQVRIDQATTGVSVGALDGAGDVVLGAKALTLGGLGGSATLSGTISGAGGSIVKAGTGTLTLTGASSYTGGTTVNAGTLSVNNKSGSATGSGTVLVASGGTLAGSGTVAGAVTVANGGILAAGNSPGTLTLGTLTLAGGATLNYELGQAGVPGGALNDLINVTGNLQLDGTLNIAQSAGGTFGPGLYRLVSYGGTLTDNGLDIGTAPAGTNPADLQVQTSVAQQVNLVNRAGVSLNFWDGGNSAGYNDGQVAGGDGTWRAGNPQPSVDSWTGMDGKVNANWAQDQFAVFSGKAGTVTVDGAGGAVRIAGAQFAVDGYVVQGDGITVNNADTVVRVGDGTAAGANMTATLDVALSGAGGISKEDAGRLILGGANTYTGGTTVKGGVLQGNATSLQGNIVNNAEVAFDQGKTAGTYAGGMSGTGRLRKIGTGTLTLAGANSYSGGTLVDAGTLSTSISGALGSGPVSVAADAALVFGGPASAGKLAYTLAKAGAGAGSTGGSLQFAGTSSAGSATIDNQGGTVRFEDSASAGTASIASGAGAIVDFADKASAGNASLTIKAGAQVRIDQAATGVAIGSLSGEGDVVLGAKALTLGGLNGDAVLSGAITGAGGSLVKVGTGALTLSGTASYSGETRVAAGSLKAGAANAFSATSSGVVASGGTLDLAGFSQQMAGLSNAGTVSLVGSAPGTTLTLSGPYVGNNGLLRLSAKLDNPGIADRLVLDGASATASGRTTVQIANLGGLGARTSGAGIEVISARNGATTTAQTTKDAFMLSGGHVDAGAFEYRLYAGDASGSGENWYLRAEAAPVAPGAPNAPGMPVAGIPTYRAEASLFAALPSQLRQSNLGMLASRSQRIGDDDVRGSAGASSSADGGNRRAWGRLISTDMDIRQGGTVSPHSEGRMTGLQAGTDLLATSDWRAGIYVGQLEGDTRVSGFSSGLPNNATGGNDLRSQYLGLYGTYAAEDGFYADAVLQAGRHRYTVQPLASGGVSGKGNSLLASIEVGKAFAIGTGGWSIEPQLQLIHQRLRLDDVAIAGAVVQQDADSGWIGRAGVRIKGSFATAGGTLQPYARLNVYRSSKGNDVARFVNPAAITPIGAPIGGTSTELAAGFTLAVSDRTSLYGEFGKLWATGGASRVGSSINASAGVRVKW